MASAFLILHGLSGSGPGHWQRWLQERLTEAGHTVRFPDLPDPDSPDPETWRRELLAELAGLDGAQAAGGGGSDERVVICHSLSCITWLSACQEIRRPVERVALVAPPSLGARLRELEPFFPVTASATDVPNGAHHTRLVCSDNDPYCPEGAAALYGDPLDVPIDLIHGGGHLNVDAGLGPWPAMEAWAQGAKNGVET
jgi:predicted alpha/beta hydrolase family esterase